VGVYHGLKFGLILHPHWSPEVYLEGQVTRQDALSREHRGPRAVLNALDRLAGSYDTQCSAVQRDVEIARGQLRDYESRLGSPFTHNTYLADLTALRDRLKAGLSGAASEPDGEGSPSISDLAEKIKALKAGHAVEAAPERTSKRQVSMEEPITSRIRRRTGATVVTGPEEECEIKATKESAEPGNLPEEQPPPAESTFLGRVQAAGRQREPEARLW
jgi:hypothetical protein